MPLRLLAVTTCRCRGGLGACVGGEGGQNRTSLFPLLSPRTYTHLHPPALLPHVQVYVRCGGEVFRDELEWDVNDPAASVQQYAATACHELGLKFDWFEAVSTHVQGMLDDVVMVRGEGGREGGTLLWKCEEALLCSEEEETKEQGTFPRETLFARVLLYHATTLRPGAICPRDEE
jgi:hypothetical protein